MNRYLGILLSLLLIPVLIFISGSIIDITLLQLKMQLARQQLLNYELSSRMIEARFRQMLMSRDDYSAEIKMNVLESSVMNFDSEKESIRLTPDQLVGVWIVNAVRKLSFKPFLQLREDQDRILLLQYAFYLERNRHFKQASEKYRQLEKMYAGSQSDDLGFVLLHNGYSLALTGDNVSALKALEKVKELFPGTHYSDTATVLIRILLDSQKTIETIENKYDNDKDRAVALFQAGQYAEAVKKFKNIENLKVDDKYVLSRSYEETGQMKQAVDGYLKLTEQKENEEVAKKANRRLLMIGSFYGGGKQVQKLAETKAKELGDEKILNDVKEGQELQLKPVIVEQIRKQKEEQKQNVAVDPEKLARLESIEKDLEVTVLKDRESTDALILKQEETKVEPPVPTPAVRRKIEVVFIDGRHVTGNSIDVENDKIIIHSGGYNITLPYSMVGKIALDQDDETGAGRIELYVKGGERIRTAEIEKREERLFIKENGSSREYPSKDLERIVPVPQ